MEPPNTTRVSPNQVLPGLPVQPGKRRGGWHQHEHEQNARDWAQRLIRERRLPLDENELLPEAYRLGNGNPYNGMRVIDHETEYGLVDVRDRGAVIRHRLKSADLYSESR